MLQSQSSSAIRFATLSPGTGDPVGALNDSYTASVTQVIQQTPQPPGSGYLPPPGSSGFDVPTALAQFENTIYASDHLIIPATDERDEIIGTASTDLLSGRGGDDALYGKGGTDFLAGGPGADLLHGG